MTGAVAGRPVLPQPLPLPGCPAGGFLGAILAAIGIATVAAEARDVPGSGQRQCLPANNSPQDRHRCGFLVRPYRPPGCDSARLEGIS